MDCPTCIGFEGRKTEMSSIGHNMFHCPRCGTLKLPNGTHGPIVEPLLIHHLKCFQSTLRVYFGD